MFTSLYPHEHGATRNGLRMRPGLPSLARALGRRGYQTAAFVGNWPLKDRISGLAEHFEPLRGGLHPQALARPVQGRGERRGPHRRRPRLAARTTRAGPPALPALGPLRRAARPLPAARGVRPPARPPPARRHLPRRTATTPRSPSPTASSAACSRPSTAIPSSRPTPCSSSPPTTARAWASTATGGTAAISTSPTLRIPLGLAWAGKIRPGTTIDAPALNLDVAPTVLGLAGLPVPAGFRGFDWTPVLQGAPPPRGRIIWFEAHKGAVLSSQEAANARRKGLLEVGLMVDGRKQILRLTEGRAGRSSTSPQDPARGPWPRRRRPALPAPPRVDGRRPAGAAASDRLGPATVGAEDAAQLRALGYRSVGPSAIFPHLETRTVPTTIKPIFLLADSQLLFWRDEEGHPFLDRARALIDDRRASAVPLRAAYLGASNGDAPEFFDLFVAAMAEIDIRDCRHVPARAVGPRTSRSWTRRTSSCSPAATCGWGWTAFEATGVKDKLARALLRRRPADRHLRRRHPARAQGVGRGRPVFDALRLVPFVVDAHDEPSWTGLLGALAQGGRARPRLRHPLGRRRHLPPRLLRRADPPSADRGRARRERPAPGAALPRRAPPRRRPRGAPARDEPGGDPRAGRCGTSAPSRSGRLRSIDDSPMKLYAIADLHLRYEVTRQALRALRPHPYDWLILAGDVGETEEHLRFALGILAERFARLLWVPGNHDLWTIPTKAGRPAGAGEVRAAGRDLPRVRRADARGPLRGLARRGGALHPGAHLRPLRLHLPARTTCRSRRRSSGRPRRTSSAPTRSSSTPTRSPRGRPGATSACASPSRAWPRPRAQAPLVIVNHFPLRQDLAVLPRIPRFSIWCGTRLTTGLAPPLPRAEPSSTATSTSAPPTSATASASRRSRSATRRTGTPPAASSPYLRQILPDPHAAPAAAKPLGGIGVPAAGVRGMPQTAPRESGNSP